MKIFTQTLFFFFLVTIIVNLLLQPQIFSQIDNKYELNSSRILQKRINPIVRSDENIKQWMQSESCPDSLSRTIVNKQLHDNGFLLIEEFWQDWDGSTWVNYQKYISTYDLENNMIEKLYQYWDNSTWVNSYKHTYTYDLNNNMIEELLQLWNSSTWVNNMKIYLHL